MVGCDGGSSAVRKQLGYRMEGEPNILEMRQALFHCPELYDKVRAPRARHYHRIDDHWTLMIVQDSRKHFTIHAVVDKDEDMKVLFEKIVGTPVKYEMVHCAKWTQRLLLAEHYQQGRVFIAGDAAHLVIPTGGLGMNTGVGDAIDVSWKLAATLQGWGGPKLLQSYEAERRQIGAINVKASGQGTSGRMKWREAYRPNIEDDTPEGKAALEHLLAIARDEAPKSFRVIGAELGYRYAGSPVICDEPGGPEPMHRGVSCRRAGRARGCRMSGSSRASFRCTIASATATRCCAWARKRPMRRACKRRSARSARRLRCSISTARRRAGSTASTIFCSGRTCMWPGAAMRCRRTRTRSRVS